MHKRYLFCLAAVMCATAISGCSDNEDNLVFLTPRTHDVPIGGVELNSKGSCQLDGDCEAGAFCYYGVCTQQCNADTACADGMVCSSSGRCLDASKAKDAGDDLEEEKNADVNGVMVGVELLDKPASTVLVPIGAKTVTVVARATKSYGSVDYVVSKPGSDTTMATAQTSELLRAEPVTDAVTGYVTYTFTIPAADSSLGSEHGSNEQFRILSSLGEFLVTLKPAIPGTGHYDGGIISDQFSGVALPIHFGVEIEPKNAQTLKDITKITLYMPTSATDLLSPDNAKADGTVQWSKLVMDRNTERGEDAPYFVASYSVNQFKAPGSKLILDSQQINRSIRVEIDAFDAASGVITGSVRDIIAGLYREVGSNGKPVWGKAEMSGTFQVSRDDGFDVQKLTDAAADAIIEHVAQAEVLRDLDNATESAPVAICTDESFSALMAKATSTDCQMLTFDDYNDSSKAELAKTCLADASDSILNDDELLSKVLEGLLTKASDDESTIGGFRTLADFLKDCAEPDGVCAERPEIVCAADLIGRAYLESSDAAEVLELLTKWHSMMRESYLGPQFAAWQSDVDIRERWLTGANFDGTPAAQVLENYNQTMLAEWESEVLKAHLGVMERQFTQTALEVLRRVDVSSDAIANRDVVLSEYAQAWEGLSDALSLGLRRYNALLTNTSERIAKASDLQVNILDLYYAGLIETYINSRTGNTSLNASYGKNLAANISQIRTLKQSFDDLVYMRDAEIVTSTSLDPNSDNTTVLNERQTLATDTLAKAESKRTYVMDKHRAETLDQKEIEDRLATNLESLFTELVTLCGRPNNTECTIDNRTEACLPNTGYGYCGFAQEAGALLQGDLAGKRSFPENSEIDDELKKIIERVGTNISSEEWESLKSLKDDEKAVAALKKYLTTNMYSDYASEVNDSEAGKAILSYRMTLEDTDIAYTDYVGTVNKANNALEACSSYENKIESWHKDRMKLMQDIKSNIRVINMHYDNITEAEKLKLENEAEAMIAAYRAQETAFSEWDKLASDRKDDVDQYITDMAGLSISSMVSGFAADTALEIREMNSAFFEADSSDPISSAAIKTAASISAMATTGAWALAAAAQLGIDIAAAGVETAQAYDDAKYEYESELADRKVDLETALAETNFAKSMAFYGETKVATAVKDEKGNIIKYECNNDNNTGYEDEEKNTDEDEDEEKNENAGFDNNKNIVKKLITTCECNDTSDLENNFDIYSENYCPAEIDGNKTGCELKHKCVPMGLEQWIIQEQNAIDQLDEVNDTMRELFEISDIYERDLVDLDFKRLEYLSLSEDVNTKAQQVQKARIGELQALKHYAALTERASMLKSQYDAALARKNEIMNLYMSPAAIFGYAGDLEVVENMIETSKDRIYDYLAAVEYFAVRPFVDLRRAIYLARSVDDLEDIITQIDTIRNKCGGLTTKASVELSAREKMGITIDYQDMKMGERFRYVMSKGNIPINALTRYTVDSNVRDLLSSGRDMRAGTFELKIDDYANLAATCNAKIDSIAIQIVGENLIKEGEGENIVPTMTLFYDGQTQLVSCQPNIEQIVASLGPKTSYGKYSTFILSSTKISPTAGLNTYGEDNVHLQGNPVATTYTVLIDTTIGENAKINWDNVDDIKLKLNYTYQDLFSTGSACTNL